MKTKEINPKWIKKLGKLVSSTREKKGFTQEDLAYESGLAVSQVSRIENGHNTTIESVFLICKAFKTTPAEFFKDFKLD